MKSNEPTCYADLLVVMAREVYSLTEDWECYKWAAFPGGVPDSKLPPDKRGCRITGGVCLATYTAGPNQGKPCFKSIDNSTKKTIKITDAEYEAWVVGWENRTGKCRECCGRKETLASVKKVKNKWESTYRTCERCHGSGKPS